MLGITLNLLSQIISHLLCIVLIPPFNDLASVGYDKICGKLACLCSFSRLFANWLGQNRKILRVRDQNGISQACYIVEIYHSGPESSICWSNSKGTFCCYFGVWAIWLRKITAALLTAPPPSPHLYPHPLPSAVNLFSSSLQVWCFFLKLTVVYNYVIYSRETIFQWLWEHLLLLPPTPLPRMTACALMLTNGFMSNFGCL